MFRTSIRVTSSSENFTMDSAFGLDCGYGPVVDVAQSLTFRMSRYFGATHLDARGKPSKFFRCYSAIVVLSLAAVALYLRVGHMTGVFGKKAIDIVKYFMGFFIQCSLITTCITHLYAPRRSVAPSRFWHAGIIETAFNLELPNNQSSENIWIAAVFIIHMISSKTDIGNQVFYTSGKFTVCLMSLYSSIIALQFRILLITASEKISRTVVQLTKGRLYYKEFLRTIYLGQLVNYVFKWQILFILIHSFGYGITYSYYIVHHYVSEDAKPFDTLFFFMTVLANFVKIWLIASAPQNFSDEVSR